MTNPQDTLVEHYVNAIDDINALLLKHDYERVPTRPLYTDGTNLIYIENLIMCEGDLDKVSSLIDVPSKHDPEEAAKLMEVVNRNKEDDK